MSFLKNHIQLHIVTDILKETLHSYIMKWIREIDNDKEALYTTDNKREIYREGLLYNNNNTINTLYNQHYIIQITQPTTPTQQNTTTKQHKKKPPNQILRVIERFLNFHRR